MAKVKTKPAMSRIEMNLVDFTYGRAQEERQVLRLLDHEDRMDET